MSTWKRPARGGGHRSGGWLTAAVAVVALGAAGAVTPAVAAPAPGGTQEAAPQDRTAVATAADGTSERAGAVRVKRPSRVRDLALKSEGRASKELPRTKTEPFSLLGVSWDGVAAGIEGTAEVRTRATETGDWTGWKKLDLDAHRAEKAEAGTRAASQPLWVGPSDGVEVRVVAEDGTTTAGLPKGLEVNLVDPGTTTAASTSGSTSKTTGKPAATATSGTAEAPQATANAAADDIPTAPPSTVTRPPIISRAQWGADESMVLDPPSYIDKVKAVFVHHTVDTNEYSCADSPALVRAVMAYHVKTEGWNDLGYNFLVDKCGRIFEGRGGGVDLPVLGAHTYGFNTESAGIAVLGDFEGDGRAAGRPTRATLESVARLAAWKLGQYGGNPSGKVTLTAGDDTGVWKKGDTPSLNVISGHRDGFATACPGKNLYAKLGEIRRYASSPGRNSAIPTSDLDHDGINDIVAGLPKAAGNGLAGAGKVTVVPGGTSGPEPTKKKTISQSSEGVEGASETGDAFGAASAWGDVNGDGYADLAVGAPGEDDTEGHADRGAVTVLYGPALNTSFMYQMGGSYPLSGAAFGSAVTVGDFDADGKAEVFAAAAGNGGTWSQKSATAERTGTLTTESATLTYMDATTGDFDRDGYADVAVNYRDGANIGRVQWFKGSASGLVKAGTLAVKGGRSVAAGDVNGNGYDDLVIGQPYTSESDAHAGGQVTVVSGSASGLSGATTVHQDSAGVPGAAENGDAMGWSVSAGDVDNDGYTDVLAGVPDEDLTRDGVNQADAGAALLLRGGASGLTGTGSASYNQDTAGISGVSETGDKVGSAVILADLSGWGRADLAIGAAGEDDGNGTILQLDSGAAGVSTTGAVYIGKTQLATDAGVRLGETLTP
ncbi:FG-GAP-like repeat-containing protein [Streptomyces tsukubensis]|uniref:Peptidoglycan recognition protein family domain-containing protein n=1 Tax=Streptomyces tsukubensis TaxID=83656 RepID=A0A1V4A374_9ACTN|nr:FG-GAP-like repeat-containing protein [Streptomyces tsukubensis]OON74436.1 hypothetical protein B1H18_25190 [Streptomyces tsukubensis]